MSNQPTAENPVIKALLKFTHSIENGKVVIYGNPEDARPTLRQFIEACAEPSGAPVHPAEPFPTGEKTDAERMQWLIRQLAMAFPSNKDWLDPALEKEAKYWATAPLLTEDPAPARVAPERLPFNALSMGTAFRYIDQDGVAGKDIFVVLETYGNGKIAAHTSPRLENAMRQSLYSFKDEEHPMDALVEVVPLGPHSVGTPSSTWNRDGTPDPHAGHYDKERAALALGHLTDDQLANGAFMYYDQKLSIGDMLNPQPGQHMPIVWMTAVKERIRWLSRSLETALSAPAPDASCFPERDTSIPANEQGLFRKFDVRRVDGSDAPGGKHHGCAYFVLDLTHDQHSNAAMRAYAYACKDTHPQLSANLAVLHGLPLQLTDEAGETCERALAQHSKAWLAVVATLNKVKPDWMYPNGSGLECAVAAIVELSNAKSDGWRDMLETLLDIYDDKDKPDSERTYVYGSFDTQMKEVKLLIEADRSASKGEKQDG